MFIGTFGVLWYKIKMRGPIVQQLCVGRDRKTNNLQTLDDRQISFFFRLQCCCFLRCQFTTLAKYARHAWSLFGTNIG